MCFLFHSPQSSSHKQSQLRRRSLPALGRARVLFQGIGSGSWRLSGLTVSLQTHKVLTESTGLLILIRQALRVSLFTACAGDKTLILKGARGEDGGLKASTAKQDFL